MSNGKVIYKPLVVDIQKDDMSKIHIGEIYIRKDTNDLYYRKSERVFKKLSNEDDIYIDNDGMITFVIEGKEHRVLNYEELGSNTLPTKLSLLGIPIIEQSHLRSPDNELLTYTVMGLEKASILMEEVNTWKWYLNGINISETEEPELKINFDKNTVPFIISVKGITDYGETELGYASTVVYIPNELPDISGMTFNKSLIFDENNVYEGYYLVLPASINTKDLEFRVEFDNSVRGEVTKIQEHLVTDWHPFDDTEFIFTASRTNFDFTETFKVIIRSTYIVDETLRALKNFDMTTVDKSVPPNLDNMTISLSDTLIENTAYPNTYIDGVVDEDGTTEHLTYQVYNVDPSSPWAFTILTCNGKSFVVVTANIPDPAVKEVYNNIRIIVTDELSGLSSEKYFHFTILNIVEKPDITNCSVKKTSHPEFEDLVTYVKNEFVLELNDRLKHRIDELEFFVESRLLDYERSYEMSENPEHQYDLSGSLRPQPTRVIISDSNTELYFNNYPVLDGILEFKVNILDRVNGTSNTFYTQFNHDDTEFGDLKLGLFKYEDDSLVTKNNPLREESKGAEIVYIGIEDEIDYTVEVSYPYYRSQAPMWRYDLTETYDLPRKPVQVDTWNIRAYLDENKPTVDVQSHVWTKDPIPIMVKYPNGSIRENSVDLYLRDDTPDYINISNGTGKVFPLIVTGIGNHISLAIPPGQPSLFQITLPLDDNERVIFPEGHFDGDIVFEISVISTHSQFIPEIRLSCDATSTNGETIDAKLGVNIVVHPDPVEGNIVETSKYSAFEGILAIRYKGHNTSVGQHFGATELFPFLIGNYVADAIKVLNPRIVPAYNPTRKFQRGVVMVGEVFGIEPSKENRTLIYSLDYNKNIDLTNYIVPSYKKSIVENYRSDSKLIFKLNETASDVIPLVLDVDEIETGLHVEVTINIVTELYPSSFSEGLLGYNAKSATALAFDSTMFYPGDYPRYVGLIDDFTGFDLLIESTPIGKGVGLANNYYGDFIQTRVTESIPSDHLNMTGIETFNEQIIALGKNYTGVFTFLAEGEVLDVPNPPVIFGSSARQYFLYYINTTIYRLFDTQFEEHIHNKGTLALANHQVCEIPTNEDDTCIDFTVINQGVHDLSNCVLKIAGFDCSSGREPYIENRAVFSIYLDGCDISPVNGINILDDDYNYDIKLTPQEAKVYRQTSSVYPTGLMYVESINTVPKQEYHATIGDTEFVFYLESREPLPAVDHIDRSYYEVTTPSSASIPQPPNSNHIYSWLDEGSEPIVYIPLVDYMPVDNILNKELDNTFIDTMYTESTYGVVEKYYNVHRENSEEFYTEYLSLNDLVENFKDGLSGTDTERITVKGRVWIYESDDVVYRRENTIDIVIDFIAQDYVTPSCPSINVAIGDTIYNGTGYDVFNPNTVDNGGLVPDITPATIIEYLDDSFNTFNIKHQITLYGSTGDLEGTILRFPDGIDSYTSSFYDTMNNTTYLPTQDDFVDNDGNKVIHVYAYNVNKADYLAKPFIKANYLLDNVDDNIPEKDCVFEHGLSTDIPGTCIQDYLMKVDDTINFPKIVPLVTFVTLRYTVVTYIDVIEYRVIYQLSTGEIYQYDIPESKGINYLFLLGKSKNIFSRDGTVSVMDQKNIYYHETGETQNIQLNVYSLLRITESGYTVYDISDHYVITYQMSYDAPVHGSRSHYELFANNPVNFSVGINAHILIPTIAEILILVSHRTGSKVYRGDITGATNNHTDFITKSSTAMGISGDALTVYYALCEDNKLFLYRKRYTDYLFDESSAETRLVANTELHTIGNFFVSDGTQMVDLTVDHNGTHVLVSSYANNVVNYEVDLQQTNSNVNSEIILIKVED